MQGLNVHNQGFGTSVIISTIFRVVCANRQCKLATRTFLTFGVTRGCLVAAKPAGAAFGPVNSKSWTAVRVTSSSCPVLVWHVILWALFTLLPATTNLILIGAFWASDIAFAGRFVEQLSRVTRLLAVSNGGSSVLYGCFVLRTNLAHVLSNLFAECSLRTFFTARLVAVRLHTHTTG